MTPETASIGFAAVGSAPRLDVLKALVRSGPDGLTTSQLQERSGIPASTMAHHLRFLAEAGVIEQIKRGRAVYNTADYDHLQKLAEYLLTECCKDCCDDTDTGQKELING